MTRPRPAMRLLEKRLERIGFKKYQPGILRMEIEPECFGWLGLNGASRRGEPGEFDVFPVMGVQHEGIEKLTAYFRGEPAKKFPTTISSPLYLHMPQEWYAATDWILTGQPTDDPIIEDIVDCVAIFGMEYVQPRASLPALTESLATERGLFDRNAYALPVALLLSGRKEEAVATMRAKMKEIGDRGDITSAPFVSFGNRFLEYVESAR